MSYYIIWEVVGEVMKKNANDDIRNTFGVKFRAIELAKNIVGSPSRAVSG